MNATRFTGMVRSSPAAIATILGAGDEIVASSSLYGGSYNLLAHTLPRFGITTTFEGQYPGLADLMRSEPIDFIGIDYAVDNRTPEEVIFPLALERDIGVLITDHNVRETLGICSRAYILSDGSLIASGSPEEILENHHVREVYLGQEFKL